MDRVYQNLIKLSCFPGFPSILSIFGHGVITLRYPCGKVQGRIMGAPLCPVDIEYNKRLDRQQPCLEGDFNGGSNNIVQSNKSV